jgi:thiamine pyrophosphate-dependent acetolactate synthase large subunit-like protein
VSSRRACPRPRAGIVVGGGHQAYFSTQMRGRPAERYMTVPEFGAVGNGLSYALGVATARRQGRDGKIVLFEGAGGLLFHIQELETLKRQGFRILICVTNDGGYGSEFHKLRADGIDDSLALFGRPALENIARGFGLRGHEIRDVSVIPKLFADFAAQGDSEIWNIQISGQVTAPIIRATIKRGHGTMGGIRASAPLHCERQRPSISFLVAERHGMMRASFVADSAAAMHAWRLWCKVDNGGTRN